MLNNNNNNNNNPLIDLNLKLLKRLIMKNKQNKFT